MNNNSGRDKPPGQSRILFQMPPARLLVCFFFSDAERERERMKMENGIVACLLLLFAVYRNTARCCVELRTVHTLRPQEDVTASALSVASVSQRDSTRGEDGNNNDNDSSISSNFKGSSCSKATTTIATAKNNTVAATASATVARSRATEVNYVPLSVCWERVAVNVCSARPCVCGRERPACAFTVHAEKEEDGDRERCWVCFLGRRKRGRAAASWGNFHRESLGYFRLKG